MAKRPESLRWTIKLAADEFGPTERTIKHRLNLLGVVPAEDGMYSTRQVHAAVCDHDRNLQRKASAEARTAEMDAEERGRELIRSGDLKPIIEKCLAAMTTAVHSAANLEREDKEKITDHLRQVWDNTVDLLAGGRKGNRQSTALHD